MQPGADSGIVTCAVEGCPFSIEYSRQALDDIRLAVVDAFFSLPRGGAEIGGLLLGEFDGRRLSIQDSLQLECEHALGPSFTLSDRDHARLEEMAASARKGAADRQPVGWYHSHTRSEVFLSEADLAIHKRHFPEPWQVALVLKPHTFEPARAGFFRRGADGKMRGDTACCEFTLQPTAVRPAPGGAPGPASATTPPQAAPQGQLASPLQPEKEADDDQHAIAIEAAAEPVTQAGPPVSEPPQRHGTPAPVDSPPERVRRERPRRWYVAAGLALLVALAAAGFETQAFWLAPFQKAFAAPPPSLGLNTVDRDGQLQIRWNTASTAVRQGLDAVLEIGDGGPVIHTIRINSPQLRTGAFTYARQGVNVDVALTLRLPDGRRVREATSFLGALPEPKAPPPDPALRGERDELAGEVSRLRAEVGAANERNRKLQRSLDDARAALNRERQIRRLRNQSPDSVK